MLPGYVCYHEDELVEDIKHTAHEPILKDFEIIRNRSFEIFDRLLLIQVLIGNFLFLITLTEYSVALYVPTRPLSTNNMSLVDLRSSIDQLDTKRPPRFSFVWTPYGVTH